jgi:hypothetical protein
LRRGGKPFRLRGRIDSPIPFCFVVYVTHFVDQKMRPMNKDIAQRRARKATRRAREQGKPEDAL